MINDLLLLFIIITISYFIYSFNNDLLFTIIDYYFYYLMIINDLLLLFIIITISYFIYSFTDYYFYYFFGY